MKINFNKIIYTLFLYLQQELLYVIFHKDYIHSTVFKNMHCRLLVLSCSINNSRTELQAEKVYS